MSGRQGSLISTAMVEEFMMPCYDAIAGFARAHGVAVVSWTRRQLRRAGAIDDEAWNHMLFPFEVQAGTTSRVSPALPGARHRRRIG